jgi:hypothetical protein
MMSEKEKFLKYRLESIEKRLDMLEKLHISSLMKAESSVLPPSAPVTTPVKLSPPPSQLESFESDPFTMIRRRSVL